jgi:uncharacterized membrane protein SirB2
MFEFAEWLQATPLSVAIQSRLWLTPLLQSVHIVMIGIVFVSMAIVALRVLGRVATEETLAVVWHRYAPWFWSALGIMAGTGIVLCISEPVRQVSAVSFWAKMTLLAIGIASAIYFGRAVAAASAGTQTGDTAGRARIAAVATIVLWLAIIFMGRSIAYDVEVWGSWHLAA